VDLWIGCNHMTCLCGHEFCFACLASWGGGRQMCACLMWDEENLLLEEGRRERAEEEHLERQLRVPERAALVQLLQVDNSERRECRHRPKGFTYREFNNPRTKSGDWRKCDNCENFITSFCFECNGCRMKFCQKCRFNRKLN